MIAPKVLLRYYINLAFVLKSINKIMGHIKTFFIFTLIMFIIVPLFVNDVKTASAACVVKADTAGLVPCGKGFDDPATTWNECNPCNFCYLILMGQLIIEFFVKMAAIAALVSIAFGGFLYVFSIGSQNTIEKAKSMIKYTLIGFVVIFIAWALINTIIATTGYSDPMGGEWYVINC